MQRSLDLVKLLMVFFISMNLYSQDVETEIIESGELIHISRDGAQLYGQMIPFEELDKYTIEEGAMVYVTAREDIITKVSGGKVFLRASSLLSGDHLMVVNPKYADEAVVAVSSLTALILFEEMHFLKEGVGSHEYFKFISTLMPRMEYPGDCSDNPHPTQSPHPTSPAENSDCHGEAGQLGICSGSMGNVQWDIRCSGVTNQYCRVWVTCKDGQKGVDSDGETVQGINVQSSYHEFFTGHVSGDKGYYTIRSSHGAHTMTLDCAR